MALLGSTVDPRLFVQDYSGFTRAADVQAQSMANLGGQIAGGIERYGEQKQERKKLEAGIKATVTGIESAIKMGESLGIRDIKSSLTPYLDKINDPNVSPIEAAAYAKEASNTISNALGFGMKANEMGIDKARYEAGVAARIAELQSSKWQPYDKEIAIDGQKVKVTGSLDQFGQFKDINNNVYSSVADAFSPSGQAEPPLADGAYPDGVPTDGTPMDGPGVLPLDKQNKVPEPDINFDFNQFPSVSGDAKVAPKVVANIEAAGGVPVAKQPALRLPPGASIVTDKTKGTFRAATPEEAQQRGAAAGQINTETNQFFPINPPPGMTIESDGKGGFKMTQGSNVGAKAEAAKEAKEEAAKQEKQSTNQMFDMAAQVIEQIPNLPDNPIGAKVAEWFGKVVPGTAAGQVAEKLGSINANIAFGVMQNMRKASPTGAAAGTMTEKEWPLFWQQYGNLSAATNKDDLRNRSQNMTLKMFDAANGSPDERRKALKEGKITPEQNAKVEEDYLKLRNRMKIPESGIPGFSDTQLNVTSGASSLFPADVQSIIDKYTPQPK